MQLNVEIKIVSFCMFERIGIFIFKFKNVINFLYYLSKRIWPKELSYIK